MNHIQLAHAVAVHLSDNIDKPAWALAATALASKTVQDKLGISECQALIDMAIEYCDAKLSDQIINSADRPVQFYDPIYDSKYQPPNEF